MAAFEYVALDQTGKQRKGIIEGDTPRQQKTKSDAGPIEFFQNQD